MLYNVEKSEVFMLKNFRLNDGAEMPAIGLGTWQSSKEDAYRAVRFAAECGYRLIDTAYNYYNEDAVGKAVAECGVDREKLFITTKLPAEIKDYKLAKEYFYSSLKAMGLDYLDLYLIHAPWPWSDVGKDYSEGNAQAWRALIELKEKGLIKSIGVSNFNGEHIDNLIKATGVAPAVNQIRFFIGNTQEPIWEYCKKAGIIIEAYSPLATGKIAEIPEIAAMAKKYGVSFAKLCLKYCVQRGTAPLPKSVTPERIKDNLDVSGFEISAEDMDVLNGIKGLFPRPYRS